MKALLDKKVFTYDDVNSLPDGNYEIIDEEMVSMTLQDLDTAILKVFFMSY